MPVYDALYDYQDKIKHVLVRHEQGASHAAEGYARLTGKPGVCLATSGPGATNLVTGIADAMMDSVPMVAITGQVFASLLGTDAFQETDVMGITMPITKWNYQVTKAEEIPEILAKAFYLAANGRPGPVVIDITKNAQMDPIPEFTYKRVTEIESCPPPAAPKQEELEQAAEIINSAERPYFVIGHGVLISGAGKALRAVAEHTGIPVGSTLHGLSAFPAGHPLYAGMVGMHGNYGPNVLTNEADVIIAVGMRFDDRVTGTLDTYAKKAQIIHIEVDEAEINKIVEVDVSLHTDAKQALEGLLPLLNKNSHDDWVARFRECDKVENEKVIQKELAPKGEAINMVKAITMLSEKTKGEAVIVADVGQHQMMSARYYKFANSDSFVTSGGLGTMGFALPAAMGAKFGAPDRDVIAIMGDGCFQMTLQELGTIAQEKLPVKAIILNNNYLGMVRQWQEHLFERRYSCVHLDNPDFIAVTKGFGIEASKVSEYSKLSEAMDALLNSEGPYLLEIVVEKETNVFPWVQAGDSISDILLE